MALIGPFPRRVLFRIALIAVLVGTVLGLATINIPTSVSPTASVGDQGRYVIDPNANGPLLGSLYSIPDELPAARGGTLGNLLRAREDRGVSKPRLMIVDLFATWCPPCQQETPILRSLDRAYRDKGLLIIGVSVQELPETVRSYVERYELEYPVLLDVDGTAFRAALAGGLPTKIILDGEWRVLQVLARPLSPSDGPELIEPLLNAP